jgi:hypothetical protein
MATYTELYEIGSEGNSPLRNKVAVANHILAVAIILESTNVTNHAARVKWATQVFSDPDGWARKMLRAIVADNAAQSVAQITAATDAVINTSCAKMVDAFAVNL